MSMQFIKHTLKNKKKDNLNLFIFFYYILKNSFIKKLSYTCILIFKLTAITTTQLIKHQTVFLINYFISFVQHTYLIYQPLQSQIGP